MTPPIAPPAKPPLGVAAPSGLAGGATVTRFSSPRDGWCQLYSVVGADPHAVAAFLADDPANQRLVNWLNDTDAVRAAIAQHNTSGVKASSNLGQVVRLLQGRVAAFLANPKSSLPPAAAYQYRGMLGPDHYDTLANSMNVEGLQNWLMSVGVGAVQNADVLSLQTIRAAYLDLVAERLRAQNVQDPVRQAELAVPLVTHGVTGQVLLAPAAPNQVTMLAELNAAGRSIRVPAINDAQVLRHMLTDYHQNRNRPLDRQEIGSLTAALASWSSAWRSAEGEAFLPLLAAAMGVGIRVHQAGQDAIVYGAGTTVIEVYRNGDHYDAVLTAEAQALALLA